MKERRIGIRELKSKLSRCVRDVKTGGTIVITDHGRRVARMVREEDSVADRIQTLKNAGSIQWSGRRLGNARPVARPHGKRTVGDIVIEGRE